MNLLDQKCVPCEGGVDPMTKADAEAMLDFHIPDWTLSDDAKYISKKFTFKDFKEALKFVNKTGEIAESEGHHPDIELGWGKVKITLTTHAIGGLSQNDFIVAAKINALK
ncbi:MAG: 4a-hydroxytetrahydrobiopterin dehydratase [Candidatus Paceibacterota bacterium]